MNVLLVGGFGYVGSVLAQALDRVEIPYDICDSAPGGDSGPAARFPHRYQEIDEASLQGYSSVLWFAGHSSVKSSIEDPDGCIRNNCLDLYRFAKKIKPNCRFIYASSASLYSRDSQSSSETAAFSSEHDEIVPKNNEYDISKFAFDYIARTFLDSFVGLRMGTVSGFSPSLRRDLIFNAMNLSAIEHGKVQVSNARSFRSILFLDDLVLLVKSLLQSAVDFKGFLNAASLSASIGEIGAAIASHHGAELIDTGESPGTYSFRLDNSQMLDAIGHAPLATLREQCDKFRAAVLSSQETVLPATHST